MKKLRTIPLRRAITAFLCGLMVFYTIACSYYKVAINTQKNLPIIVAQQSQKIMYLHNGSDVYLIKSLKMAEADGMESVSMDIVQANEPVSIKPHQTEYSTKKTPIWDTVYINTPHYVPGKSKRYNSTQEAGIIREVHFYLNAPVTGLAPGIVQIPAASFYEIHVISKDAAKSAVVTVLTTLGVTGGLFLLLGIILVLTKSSCPYVYAFDGNQYVLQGEIYSGAVLRNLERADHLPMPLLQAVQGEYRLRIANELKEQQYVNFASLKAIRHPEGTQALFDVTGAPQLISQPQPPIQAESALGQDLRMLVIQSDQQAFQFDEQEALKNSARLSFRNQPGAMHAKLLLNAKNTLWFDHLFGRFATKFGSAYPAWVQTQQSMTTEQRVQAQNDQDFPLSVYIKTSSGQWEPAGKFPMAGPLAWRDMVLPLDPVMLQGETVEIRLETGYRFWEINYVAIDFSNNVDMKLVTMPTKSAKDQSGKSQLKALADNDGLYLEQLSTGNYTEMIFKALPPPRGQAQTLFLHCKGYYVHVRDFNGQPQLGELEKFRQPHYFDQFSKTEFRQFMSGMRIESDEVIIK